MNALASNKENANVLPLGTKKNNFSGFVDL